MGFKSILRTDECKIWREKREWQSSLVTKYKYRGIHEKGSGDVVSVVSYTINTIYILSIPLLAQTAETTSPEPFS